MFSRLQDPDLLNFNFCDVFDPDLRSGPDQTHLYRLTIESRHAARGAAFEFGNTMYWTLRPATFECFQRAHGPRPIEYRDYFYSKLLQYFDILLFDKLHVYGMGEEPRTERPWEEGVLDGSGPILQDDDVELALFPDDNERIHWGELVQRLGQATENRLDILQAWLKTQRETIVPACSVRDRGEENQEPRIESPAEVIDRLRGARHWTIEQLAAKAGVDIKQVYKVKRGEGVHTDTVRKLEVALGCKKGDLLSE